MWLRLVALVSLTGLSLAGSSGSVNTWGGTLQYDEDWGYVTVRGKGHTFWWLYAVKPANNRPLFLWLQVWEGALKGNNSQGGPGSDSSGFGNIDEIGPKDLNENDRASTWVCILCVSRRNSQLQVADLVFVDNPVGAGFSYVDDSSAYTTNVTQIGSLKRGTDLGSQARTC